MRDPLETIAGQFKGLMGVSFSPIPSSPSEEASRIMAREREPSAQTIKLGVPSSQDPVDNLLNRIAEIMQDMLSKEKAATSAPESFGQGTGRTGILGPVVEKTTGLLAEEPPVPISPGGGTSVPTVVGLPGPSLPPPPPGPAPAPGRALEILEQVLRRR